MRLDMSEDSNDDHKKRHEKKRLKYSELLQENEELESLLSLKRDILEKTDKKNSKLFDENRQLRETNFRLQQEKDEAVKRLNDLGETGKDLKRLYLSDFKSARIREQWEALYNREWTAAFEELCAQQNNQKCHKEPEKRLLEVTGWCYEKCSNLAKDQMEKVKPLLAGVACIMNLQPLQQSENCMPDDVSNTFRTLLKYVQQRMDDMGIIENVKKKCLEEFKECHNTELNNEVKFASKCCEICWQMRSLDPPMQIQFRDLETKKCDKTKFNKYNVIGDHIESVVWPVLFLHENGPVISKGLVRTYTDSHKYGYDERQSKHFSRGVEYDETSGIKREENIYISMRYPNDLNPCLPHCNERINPFDTDKRPLTVHHDFENSTKFENLSKSDGMTKFLEGNLDIISESNIDLRKRLPTPKLMRPYENKSPFEADFNSTHKNRHQGKKTKEPVSPKDGTFVSYLYTNSSTI